MAKLVRALVLQHYLHCFYYDSMRQNLAEYYITLFWKFVKLVRADMAKHELRSIRLLKHINIYYYSKGI